MLRSIWMPQSKIKELPTSIGMLKRLEELNAEGCELLAEIPSTIKWLTCLRVLNLEGTCVSQSPPKLPTSLTELYVSSTSLQIVPKLPMLHNLVGLVLSNGNCFGESGQLRPSKLQGIGNLCGLEELKLKLNITSISEEFSSLSQLQSLTLECPNLQSRPPLPSSLSKLILESLKKRTKLPRLSNLKNRF
ncbi:leucine-rich repeat-containing protein 40-like [Punica granatum]|uniref:Leucine-rich repeat-containing protein 40-like n=1 Tax=Punica granatum TaxID=22663 RepID=A0A6P8C280_PUNGR|nr:leucine-rich repeat-containing protein 40-like [Punica granatum]